MFMSERQFIRILARIVGFFALVTVGLAAAGLAAHGAVPSERGPERGIAVTPRVDLDHRFIPVGEAVPVYVMVRFAARGRSSGFRHAASLPQPGAVCSTARARWRTGESWNISSGPPRC